MPYPSANDTHDKFFPLNPSLLVDSPEHSVASLSRLSEIAFSEMVTAISALPQLATIYANAPKKYLGIIADHFEALLPALLAGDTDLSRLFLLLQYYPSSFYAQLIGNLTDSFTTNHNLLLLLQVHSWLTENSLTVPDELYLHARRLLRHDDANLCALAYAISDLEHFEIDSREDQLKIFALERFTSQVSDCSDPPSLTDLFERLPSAYHHIIESRFAAILEDVHLLGSLSEFYSLNQFPQHLVLDRVNSLLLSCENLHIFIGLSLACPIPAFFRIVLDRISTLFQALDCDARTEFSSIYASNPITPKEICEILESTT